MGAESQGSFGPRETAWLPEEVVRPFLLALPKAWKVAMDGHQKTHHYSDRSPSRSGSLLGLLVPLPQIYPWHLTRFSPPAGYEQPKSRLPVLGHHPETPTAPERQDNSCSICKAASSFQDYFCSYPLPLPDKASRFRLIFSGDPVKDLSAALMLLAAPRPHPFPFNQAESPTLLSSSGAHRLSRRAAEIPAPVGLSKPPGLKRCSREPR